MTPLLLMQACNKLHQSPVSIFNPCSTSSISVIDPIQYWNETKQNDLILALIRVVVSLWGFWSSLFRKSQRHDFSLASPSPFAVWCRRETDPLTCSPLLLPPCMSLVRPRLLFACFSCFCLTRLLPFQEVGAFLLKQECLDPKAFREHREISCWHLGVMA